ncbi:MAG TPA: hypothetical protein VHZ95_21035, partial [Polyangiales bacterium]|nr:hypothetical protein [Polyangiales bacterium]
MTQPKTPTVLIVASDFPGYFARLCHALGSALVAEGINPIFLVGTRYYERFNRVDFSELGPVYALSHGITATDDSADAAPLDRWLLHATFIRTRYFLGHHPNAWADYRRAAAFIRTLFEREPGVAAVFSELPSNATTSLVCAEATRRGVPYLGYGSARIPGHINVGLDQQFTQLLENPVPPAHAKVGAPDYTKIARNMLERSSYRTLLFPRMSKLSSLPLTSQERSLELGGFPQRYQVHGVVN